MANFAAADIERLCDAWCAASTTHAGDLQMGGETEKFRLLQNGVVFHELNHETLCEALVSLSKVLLRPGLSAVVDNDHFAAWAWCGQLLVTSSARIFTNEQVEIRSLYEASIHAALAHCRKPTVGLAEWQEQRHSDSLQPHHGRQLLQQSYLVLAYLAFPLLEAVLKRACAAYVAFNGQVVSAFSVPSKQGSPKPYGPTGSPGSSRCSSLRDLLHLHFTAVAHPHQRIFLDRFRVHLNALDATQDPFDLIYDWRNQSLHGSTNFETIGGTMLSLALLISLFEIEQDFEERRLKTIEICQWEAQHSSKSPWSFYPPY